MTQFALNDDQVAIRDMASAFAAENLAPHAVAWDEAKNALRRGAPLTGQERGRILDALHDELGGFPKVAASGAELLRDMREEDG